MIPRLSTPIVLALGVLVGTTLPLAARGAFGPRLTTVVPPHPVRLVDAAGKAHTFGCVSHAARWVLHVGQGPREILVTDEASRIEIPDEAAWYVRGTALPGDLAGDRVRAFAKREDAERLAESVKGTLLLGRDRPFEPGADEDPACR